MLSLTATELPRFMACNGYRLMGGIEPISRDQTVTDQGNAAHWYIEQVFRNNKFDAQLQAPNGIFITSEMIEHCSTYLKDVVGIGEIESDTSWGPIRGRADHQDFNGATLTVRDFKYGWRIIEPFEHWTLISHAVGILNRMTVKPKFVCFKIYQPRPFHPEGQVREWTISYEKFLIYAQKLQDVLANPSDFLRTGTHCHNCQSMSQCPAMQITAMNAIDMAYSAFNSEIDETRLSWMLDLLSRAKDVLNQNYDAYEELAIHRLRTGKKSIPEYTLSQGKGTTTWKEGVTAELIKAVTGVDIVKKELMTPKQSGLPENILTMFTHRPNTGIKLVRQDVNEKAKKLLGKKE